MFRRVSQISWIAHRRGDLWAIFLIFTAALYFCGMNYFVRLSRPFYRADTLVFYRSLFQMIILLPWIREFLGVGLMGSWRKKLFFHGARGSFGVGSMFCLYLSLKYLPLAAATLLALSSVLWAMFFAYLGLGEKVSKTEMGWIALALLGMIICVASTEGGKNWHLDPRGVIAGLGCGIFMGLALTSLRKLRLTLDTKEIVFFFGLSGVMLTLPSVVINFQLPETLQHLGWIVALGFSGSLGQLWMTSGFRYTSTAVASLGNLLQTPVNLAIGFWFLNEVPPTHFYGGGLLTLFGLLGLIHSRGGTNVRKN